MKSNDEIIDVFRIVLSNLSNQERLDIEIEFESIMNADDKTLEARMKESVECLNKRIVRKQCHS